jgi:hypothetical protein
MFHVQDSIDSDLYVVTALFNPVRFKSRWKLYQRFAKMVQDAGAKLITVEAAFGERDFAADHIPVTSYVPLRTRSEVWLKENMINVGISRVPANAKYIAWIDADVVFARPNWVGETIHQLQHYHVVQMFSDAIDLGPTHEPIAHHKGFMYCYHNIGAASTPGFNTGGYNTGCGESPSKINLWHPGYAWAARREALDAVGGLFDVAALGAGDNHMAKALVGRVQDSVHPNVQQNYRDHLERWQDRAERHIKRNVGYVSGLLLHYWHGSKKSRQYWDRWRILVDNGYCPDYDLKRDSQGLWQLTGQKPVMRDQMRAYFRQRSEDSIDLQDHDIKM